MAIPAWCPRCKTPQDVRRDNAGGCVYVKHKDRRTGARCENSGEKRVLRRKKRKTRTGIKSTSV
jgi:hypothetical protein